MKLVQKYKLGIRDEQRLTVPNRYRFVHVAAPGGADPYIWAIVDPEAPECEVAVHMRGTGVALGLAEAYQYVGSWHLASGDGGHVFIEHTP